jgi:acetolactate synthase regulatory subunit
MTGLFKFIPNIVKEKLIKLLKIYSVIANGFWIQIAMKSTGLDMPRWYWRYLVVRDRSGDTLTFQMDKIVVMSQRAKSEQC